MEHIKDIQIVVLFNPYDSFSEDSELRELLMKVFKLKFEGYKSYFPYGVLPIDHLDFISNHVLICQKSDSSLTPIAGWKSLSLDQCKKFNLPFPIKNHLLKGNEDIYGDHSEAIDRWLVDKTPNETAYNFGYTVDPSLKKEVKQELTQIGLALLYFYYTYYDMVNVIHGVSKTFKLAEKHHELGFNLLGPGKNPLPAVMTKAYNNVESYIMHIENKAFSNNYSLKAEKQYGSLWGERLELGINNTPAKSINDSKKVA